MALQEEGDEFDRSFESNNFRHSFAIKLHTDFRIVLYLRLNLFLKFSKVAALQVFSCAIGSSEAIVTMG